MPILAIGFLWSVYPNDAYILSIRVGNAHPRRILPESADNEFQIKNKFSYNSCAYMQK